MKKKIIGIIVASVIDTEEDIGLLVYDYRVDSHEYSGGISNADGSLIKHDSDNIVVWNKEELNNLSVSLIPLSCQCNSES